MGFVSVLYGVAVYVLFLATFVYLIGFVGNVFVPKSIDSGATAPLAQAVTVDLVLLGMFAVQHSVMARRWFKSRWTRIVSPAVERSTFVFAATATLAILMWQWRPIAQPVIWSVESPIGANVLWGVFWLGWGILLLSTFLINHFELFGLQQVLARLHGRVLPESELRTPLFYRYVRHPIYLGFLLAFWATPVMTAGHLLFSIAMTAYILIGISFEERDLVAQFGDRYRHYRERVGMLLPSSRNNSSGPFVAVVVLLTAFGAHAQPAHLPATLANPGFEGQPVKSVFFFAGEWRSPFAPNPFYDGPVPGVRLRPAANDCIYTIFPIDGRVHLGWSDNIGGEKREHALNLMLAAGVNVVNMSYWGPPNSDRWAFWAPMQTAPGAHDELFDAAVGKPLLIIPYIEDSDATLGRQQSSCGLTGPVGQSPGYHFADAFPGTADDPSPQLVEQIVDLVERYLLHPRNDAWPAKWAQMYDREGAKRYVVSLIHVGSAQPGVTDETFARGFTAVADRVHARTGVRVGFLLDVLPPEERHVPFKASPTRTGPLLAQQAAVLAIQPFNPEVFTGRCRAGDGCDAPSGLPPKLAELLAWKRDYISSWIRTGIPVIADVSPGYDARKLDSNSSRYGNNAAWRDGQAALFSPDVRGLTANTWNGYTEGYAIVPSCTAGPPGLPPCVRPPLPSSADAFRWFRGLAPPGGTPATRLPAKLVGTNPSSGVYSDPVTLTFRLTSFDLEQALFDLPHPVPVPDGEVVIHLGRQQVRGTTDANGVVSVSVAIEEPAGDVSLGASFGGDARYLSIEAAQTSLSVQKEQTVIRWLADENPPGLRGHVLAARLTDDDGQVVRDRTVTFAVDSEPLAGRCAAVTDADGVARCKVDVARRPGSRTVTMEFAGDAYYDATMMRQEIDLNPR